MEGFRGAQIQLLPCIPYRIRVTYNLYSWDSYNSVNGLWDVLFFNINSETSIFAPGVWDQLGDVFCSTADDSTGLWLPGYTWWFGGENSDDGMQCHLMGTAAPVMFQEPDSSLEVFLAAAIDTGFVYPSWGWFTFTIGSPTLGFDPNPITALNDDTLTDEDDINAAVPCDAYTAVNLTNLDTPTPGDPWQLTGDYCQIADIPAPPGLTGIPFTPPTSRNDDFPYIRDCDAFEAVMAYDHITRNQLYIQGLGFTSVNNRQIEVDPHNIEEDNSFYIGDGMGTGHLGFGDGGTDDAEDADVIIHEYGHSIQDNQRPTFFHGPNDNGFGDETGAIGEGFGDYWACSTFNAQNEASGFNPALFAEWDAPPDGLRNLANSKIYPDDMVNLIHADGEIWSGALWDIFHLLGKATTDTLVLESHDQLMMPDPDFVDNAEAVLAADVVHFGGANRLTLAEAFAARGIFRQLTVQSSPAGAAIDLDIADVLGDEDGTAEFVRFYPYNEAVTLTAPAIMPSGNPFERWSLDGVSQPAGDLILDVIMNQAHIALAIFGPPVVAFGLDGDGSVGVKDLLILLGAWGPCADCKLPGDCPADLDGDCTVGVVDLLIVLGNWG